MGTAILCGVLDATADSSGPISQYTAVVRSESSARSLETTLANYKERVNVSYNDNVRAAKQADIIVLGHKPYMLNGVLGADGMADAIRGKLVISVLGGVSVTQIVDTLYGIEESSKDSPDPPCHVVRTVPNLGAKVRECTTIMEEPKPSLPGRLLDVSKWLFEQIGIVTILPEPLMNAAAILVAVPALASVAVDGILDGCVAEGVPRATAMAATAQCFLALAKLLQEGTHPAALRESTSSPRGCTIQGLLQLERTGVRAAFADSIIKGAERARVMGKQQD